MEDALIVGIVFFSIFSIIKLFSDHLMRKRIIEQGLLDPRSRRVLSGQTDLVVLNNLKWGMVLVGVGLASLLSYWLPDYVEDEGALGLMLLFAGLGFLIYYPIAQKRLREIESEEDKVDTTPAGS